MRITKALTTGIAALAFAASAAATLIPVASADPNDNAFVNAMEDQNNIWSIAGPADLIQAGHQVCGLLSPTVSPAMVINDVVHASLYGGRFYSLLAGTHQPINQTQASQLVNYAIGTYCLNSEGAKHWGVGGPYPPHNPEGPYGTCQEGGACW
jgi:hypothetical protein